MTDSEQEVERIVLGVRGELTFVNQIQDVLENVSCGIVYHSRSDKLEPILKKDGFIIDNVWYRDLTGNSLKEVGISWRNISSDEEYSNYENHLFEIFTVTASGKLNLIFPLNETDLYNGSGSVIIKEKTPGFSISRQLNEITQKRPQITCVTSFLYNQNKFTICNETIEEPETVGHRLNLASHYYSSGNFEKGLIVARRALEGVRISTANKFLGKAYSLVATGYKKCGKPELASLYEKRAALTISETNPN